MQFFKSGTFVRCREEQCVVERRTRFLLPDLRGSWGSACPSRLHATKSNKLLNPFLGIDTHVNEDTGLASSEMRSCKAAGMPPSCKGEAEAFLIVHSLFCLLGSATDHNRPRACACDSSAVCVVKRTGSHFCMLHFNAFIILEKSERKPGSRLREEGALPSPRELA